MKIYILLRHIGSYDDYEMSVVKAFNDLQTIESITKALNEACYLKDNRKINKEKFLQVFEKYNIPFNDEEQYARFDYQELELVEN